MLNFLPEHEQKSIRRMYRVRLFSIVLSFVSVSAVIALLLLIPSYYLSTQQAKAVALQHERIVGTEVARDEGALKTLNELQESLRALDTLETVYPTDVVRVVLDALPGSVRIDRLRYDHNTDHVALMVFGVAKTRGDLLVFKDTLARTPKVADVILPIDFLAREQDVTFQMTFNYQGLNE